MSQLQDLLNGQYEAVIQGLQQVGGSYIGQDFRIHSGLVPWSLKLGRYNQFSGYWIFRTDVKQCWQAINGGGGGLAWWNADGHAAGNPENWELFAFELANQNDVAVRIHNVGASGNYIGLVGDLFNCSANKNNAAQFYVHF